MTDIEAALDDIRTAHQASAMTDQDQRNIAAFREVHAGPIANLRNQVLAVTLYWLSTARGYSPQELVIEQIALQELHMVLALVGRGMKARRDEQLMPGRVAFAAFEISKIVAAMEPFAPVDLTLGDKIFADLMTPIERERDDLRRTLASIAEDAITCEGDRLSDPDYADSDLIDVTVSVGDMRAAVRLTNHDCQNGDRIKFAGPTAETSAS